MPVTHVIAKAGTPPVPAARGPTWLCLGPPHLTRLAVHLSLHLRWILLLIALMSYAAGMSSDGALLLAAAIAGFNAVLYLCAWRGWRAPILVLAAADALFISLLIALRGGVVSESYLLYALPIFYLALYYAWRGAVAGFVLTVCSYAITFYVTRTTEPLPADFDLNTHLFVRGTYFILISVVLSVIVEEQERHQLREEQMHARLREQVRRLEVIQRITQQLNTAPTSREVARIIVEETRAVITFQNCRVHRIEDGPEGARLALVALYGQPIDAGSALPETADKLRLGEGITGWVALHGEPVLLADAGQDPRAQHVPGSSQAPNSLLAVPLVMNRRVQGVIVLSAEGANAFSEDDLQMMVTLANAAAIAIENIESRDSLARQAQTDAVTGLPHHGAFLSALQQALRAAQTRGEPLALALFDIDGFRGYNDRRGLAAGDDALRHVAECLAQTRYALCSREAADVETCCLGDNRVPLAQCFRIGGDEFALLLSGPLGQTDAAIAAVRDCIERVDTSEGGAGLLRVTVSAGMAIYPLDATTRRELLDTAEAALYLVRQTGGNRLGLADAAAKETLQLRHRLEDLVHTSLAESGSPDAVQQLVAQATSLTQQAQHADLAERLTTEALQALAAAIDAKDDYTRGHSERVAATATEIARCMKLPGALVEHITTAARMHDIGKIGVPDQILHKRGPLTSLEQAIVAAHPEIGADILAPIHTLGEVVAIVRHHHEHYDGQGYPEGLAGEKIPIGARVVAVADTIDAMITNRPYRPGMAIADALAELQKWAGDFYDPQVVAAAVTLYAPGGSGLALHGVRPAFATLPSAAPASPLTPLDPAARLEDVMYPEPVSAPRELLHLRHMRAAPESPREAAE